MWHSPGPTTRQAASRLFVAALLTLQLIVIPASLSAWAPVAVPGNATNGAWAKAYTWHGDTSGAHMILMRGKAGTSHSQVLYFYGSGGCSSSQQPRVWNLNPYETFVTDTVFSANPEILLKPVCYNFFCGAHSALADGTVLFSGGTESAEGLGIESTMIFDPADQTWKNDKAMKNNRWYPTSTTLGDGRVLVTSGRRYKQLVAFGGRDSLSSSTKNSLGAVLGLRKKMTTDLTSVSGSLPSARQGHVAVYDGVNTGAHADETAFPLDQRVVIFGGKNSAGTYLSDFWGLDRTQSSVWDWDSLATVADVSYGRPSARAGHAAVFDSLRVMYIVGGLNGSGSMKDLWALNLRANGGVPDTLKRVSLVGADTMQARSGHSVIFQKSGAEKRLIVFGGVNGSTYFNDVWKLRISSQDTSWTKITPNGTPPAKRAGHVAVYDYRSKKPRMIVFGGRNGSTAFRDLWSLSLAQSGTPTWKELTPADTTGLAARFDAAGIFDVENRRLVIVGGDTTITSPGGEKSDVWKVSLDSTATFKWERDFGNLPSGPRASLTATYDSRWIDADLPEIYDPASPSNPWSLMGSGASKFILLYPNMFLLPSGKLFYAHPSQTYTLDMSVPSWTAGPTSGQESGSSVMYAPGKIMKCGAEHGTGTDQTQYIDMTIGSPVWNTGNEMPAIRTKHNLTSLPNGKVLMTGGLRAGSDTTTAEREPIVWDPTTYTWGSELAPEPVVREYHSTAILLPDGRILCAGGFLNGNPNKSNCTIFYPPYLFNGDGTLATKPVVTSLDSVLTYGSAFNICLADTTTISRVTLIKPGAVTHQFNQDQRFVELSFTSRIQGTKRIINATAPASGNYAPPGDYMLFLLKSNGVPSLANWVRVGSTPPACSNTVPCYAWTGTLASNQTWTSSNGPHVINGELTVPTGKTLRIETGAHVVVIAGGVVKVDGGTLWAAGVTFRGTGCTASKWTGIQVEDGTATMTSCVIRDADIGISFSGGTGGGTVSRCRVISAGTEGIRVNNNATITLDRDTIDCPATSSFIGIHVGSSADGTNTIKRSRINGTSASSCKGILCEATATFKGNKVYGFTGSSARGIEFNLAIGDTNATVRLEKFPAAGGDPDEYPHVLKCTTGIYIASYSRPSIYATRIDSSTYAFWVTSLAEPEIANVETNPGCDVTNSTTKHIRSNIRLSTTPYVKALYNWWGTATSSEISAKMDSNVDWDPFLGSDPIGSLARRMQTEPAPGIPIAQLLGNRPNPFQNTTEIHFVAPAAGLKLSIQVYDVSGRLIRAAEDETKGAGASQWDWDGRDGAGTSVPSGIYYYRVAIGDGFVNSRKMLLIR